MSPVLLRPPLSKSDAQRALVLAEALGVPLDTVVPPDEELPRDVRVLRRGLEQLREPESDIDCHDGGAPFRFLLTQAALAPGRVTRFTGTPRLGERPHGPLLESLRGALAPWGFTMEAGHPWPLVTRAGPAWPRGVEFEVTGAESSQFASSLLLGCARVAQATGQSASVLVRGPLTSEGYLELTRSWLLRAGFGLETADGGQRMVVLPSGGLGRLEVPGDWSSLTYLLALAWKSGAEVERVDFSAAHPDRAFVEHLESVGLTVHRGSRVRVTGVPRGGLDVDAQVCPDAVPTLAVVAAVLERPSTFTRVGILRHKESDRLEAVMELLARAGVTTSLEQDTLTVVPGAVRDFEFDARDDHRLAMSATVLSYLGGVRLSLHGKKAVAKSFPGFWREVEKLGFAVSEP
jgi:3-phosphoshikimate 1-carboxyvinyltransferase